MNNYFPHDSNSRNSDRVIPLRAKLGVEGYGIYFMLLERLREEPSYASVIDYTMLAFDLRVDAAKIKEVVEDFGLFAFTDDGEYFFSDSFLRRMQAKDEKSEKARKSALSRWSKCESNANAQKTDAYKEKERKEQKQSTQDKSFVESSGGTLLMGDCESENSNDSLKPPAREKKNCGKRKEADLRFVEPSFRPVMADWLAYKSERGQTYRQQGITACYSKLQELSCGSPELARKIIWQSMANNYAGLFPLKTGSASKYPATDYHHDKSTIYAQF